MAAEDGSDNYRVLHQLELDYTSTQENFRMLAEIRLKLLAFVPTIAGIAFSLLVNSDSSVTIGVGLIGFVVTLGIVMYELRNTQLYDASMQRMRVLEWRLGFKSTVGKHSTPGGVHLGRPGRSHSFMLLPVVHDYGLALIYASSLTV